MTILTCHRQNVHVSNILRRLSHILVTKTIEDVILVSRLSPTYVTITCRTRHPQAVTNIVTGAKIKSRFHKNRDLNERQ